MYDGGDDDDGGVDDDDEGVSHVTGQALEARGGPATGQALDCVATRGTSLWPYKLTLSGRDMRLPAAVRGVMTAAVTVTPASEG